MCLCIGLTRLTTVQLEALKSAMRQMAEEKDAAVAGALAPLQAQLQVWQLIELILNRSWMHATHVFSECPKWPQIMHQRY